LSFLMIAGRLEIFPVVLLFTRTCGDGEGTPVATSLSCRGCESL
jgi:hypothetical protein